MPQIYLIGIGMGNPDTLTVRAQRIIGQSDCLIGAKRMLESVENDRAVRISSIKNEEIVSAILQHRRTALFRCCFRAMSDFTVRQRSFAAASVNRLPGQSWN